MEPDGAAKLPGVWQGGYWIIHSAISNFGIIKRHFLSTH